MNWIRPDELYNKLNLIFGRTPCLSRPHFMLILDVRCKTDYFFGHLLTAKRVVKVKNNVWRVTGGFSDLTDKEMVVIYDMNSTKSDTSMLSEPLAELSSHVWRLLAGSRNQSNIFLLDGGFEAFTKLYPNCKAYQATYTIGELARLQVLPLHIRLSETERGKLYYSPTDTVAADRVAHLLSDIDAHVNCSVICDPVFGHSPEEKFLVHYCVLDNDPGITEATVLENLKQIYNACLYIDAHLGDERNVLVFGEQGNTTAVVVLVSYLMFHEIMELEDAVHRICLCYPLAVIDETSRVCLEIFHDRLRTDTDFQTGVMFSADGDPALPLENYGSVRSPSSIVSSLMKDIMVELEKKKEKAIQKRTSDVNFSTAEFSPSPLEVRRLEEETQWKILHHDRVAPDLYQTQTVLQLMQPERLVDVLRRRSTQELLREN